MRRPKQPASIGLLGGFLVLATLAGAAWAGVTACRWGLAYRWPAVPCEIVASGLRAGGERHPYAFDVSYRYAWRGQEFTGTTYSEEYRGSTDVAEAERLARSFPEGSRRLCYVNPADPATAVLKHDNPLVPAILTVALLCCAVGLVGVFLRRSNGFLLGGPFLIFVGLAGHLMFFTMPLWNGLRSLRWPAVPCIIEDGNVRSARNSGIISFNVYWPDIVYRYQVGDRTYRANTNNASFVGSPWYYGARRVVREHPPLRSATCYVNPANPSEAVLVRGASETQWYGLWPLFMAALGLDTVVRSLIGRGLPRVGSPRAWGTAAVWAGGGFAFTILLTTAGDLYSDAHAGVAEWPEFVATGVAGLLAFGLVPCCVATLLPRKATDASAHAIKRGQCRPKVWDREIDG